MFMVLSPRTLLVEEAECHTGDAYEEAEGAQGPLAIGRSVHRGRQHWRVALDITCVIAAPAVASPSASYSYVLEYLTISCNNWSYEICPRK